MYIFKDLAFEILADTYPHFAPAILVTSDNINGDVFADIVPGSEQILCVLNPDESFEIVSVTLKRYRQGVVEIDWSNQATTILTIDRGVHGTDAITLVAGAKVYSIVSAQMMTELFAAKDQLSYDNILTSSGNVMVGSDGNLVISS